MWNQQMYEGAVARFWHGVVEEHDVKLLHFEHEARLRAYVWEPRVPGEERRLLAEVEVPAECLAANVDISEVARYMYRRAQESKEKHG